MVLNKVNELMTAQAYKELAEVFALETKLTVTEGQVQQFLKSQHKEKIEKADINTMDRVFDDIKDFFKFDAENNKDELWFVLFYLKVNMCILV